MGLFSRKKNIWNSGLLEGATDCHSHVLYGVDDGSSDLDSSLAILERMEAAGLSTLWLTPHIMEDIPNSTAALKQRFGELCQAYKGSIKLQLSAEYMIDPLLLSRLESSDLLPHSENRLLVENSAWNASENWIFILERIISLGYVPLLAHVERYSFLSHSDYENLRSLGVLFQLNLGSLTGFYGSRSLSNARYLLDAGMYSCAGSDCHGIASLERQYSSNDLSKSDIEAIYVLLHN